MAVTFNFFFFLFLSDQRQQTCCYFESPTDDTTPSGGAEDVYMESSERGQRLGYEGNIPVTDREEQDERETGPGCPRMEDGWGRECMRCRRLCRASPVSNGILYRQRIGQLQLVVWEGSSSFLVLRRNRGACAWTWSSCLHGWEQPHRELGQV